MTQTSFTGLIGDWSPLVASHHIERLNFLSTVMIKPCDQKQLGGERVHLASASTSQSITEGSQGRNSDVTPVRN